jgi:hypothetical protein
MRRSGRPRRYGNSPLTAFGKTEDISGYQTHYLRMPTCVALGKPKSDSTRGDTIPVLGGTYAGCARVANILRRRPSYRLAVRSANLLQVAPLKEIRKKAGLGLDPQTVGSSLGPVGAAQQYLARPRLLHKTAQNHPSRHRPTFSRKFAMGVQGLPSNNHYLSQEPMEELLKAHLHVRKQRLGRQLSRHGNDRNSVSLRKQRSIPRNANL